MSIARALAAHSLRAPLTPAFLDGIAAGATSLEVVPALTCVQGGFCDQSW